MAKAVIMGGGGGGISSDELTAARGDVLKGKTAVTSDSSDEPVEGTLELTGDAADSHVLSGKTYYNKDPKTRRAGTMPNRGAVAQELAAGGSYTVPEGYHNGAGKVTAKSLASQTGGATAADGDVLSGKTYWKDGAKRTGTMANQGAKTAALNAGGSYAIPAGYHNGSGRVTANSLASQTGGATAADGDVLSGKTYWKDGAKRTGSMANRGALNVTLNPGGSQSVAAGYYSGGTIRANAAGNPCISGTMIANDIYKQGRRTFTKADGSSVDRSYIKITGALSGGKTLRGFGALGESSDTYVIGAIYTGSGNPYAIQGAYKWRDGSSGNFKPASVHEYNLASCISGNDVYIPMQSSSTSTSHIIRYFCVAN